MKSYTDIEQSKKLAKILPIESADMLWEQHGAEPYVTIKPWTTIGKSIGCHCLSCWSLAALLGVLPKKVEIADNVYSLSIYLTGLYYWNVNNGNLLLEVKYKDNLIDACVKMIEKLHEQNLI